MKINDAPPERKPLAACIDCGAVIPRRSKRCKPCSADHSMKMAAARQRAKRNPAGAVRG